MFTLSDDHQALAEVAGQFAADHLAPQALEWDRTKHFPVDVLAQAGEIGVGGMYVNEDVGGSGMTRLDAAVVIEALATGCPSIASYISIHNMVAWMIDRFGSDDLRHRYLPTLTSMEDLGSYCLTEPGAGSDAGAITTRAVRDGDEWVLNGVKQFISGAGSSRVYVVMAKTSAGISAFVVENDAPGLSFGPNEIKMGWNAQPTRQVVLEDVRIPVGNLLGEDGKGFRIALSGLNGGRVNIAASSIGGAQAAFGRTVTYLRDRKAFGQSLDNFQTVQFRLADMATSLIAARLMVHRAAAAIDAGDPDTITLCAMAKKFATDAAFDVANGCLQLHGGYGYLNEYGIEKIVRDLRVHQILEGTNEIMQVVIARSLVKS